MGILQYTVGAPAINKQDVNISFSADSNNKTIGLLLFLAAATMFFVGLIGAYIVMRPSLPDGIINKLNPVLTINTFVLLLSSITLGFAQGMSYHKKIQLVKLFLFFTIITGISFLMLQFFLWNQMTEHGVTLSTPLGSNIYLFTGAHLIHILGGLIAIGVVTFKIMFGLYTNENHKKGVTLCGIYWHFVNIIWLTIYILLVFWK